MAFKDIFKDENEFNEKTIIGFMSFAVMTLYSLTDLITFFYVFYLLHFYLASLPPITFSTPAIPKQPNVIYRKLLYTKSFMGNSIPI